MRKFLIETHVHTAEVSPCGKVPAREMVGLYGDAGYDGLIITDHYIRSLPAFREKADARTRVERYLEGYRKAREEGEKTGILVFWALEATLDAIPNNDFLVFGVTEELLTAHPELYSYSPDRFRAVVSSSGALIIQAHPFRNYCSVQPLSFIDGVESFNGNPRHESSNGRAAAFAAENGLIETSGSDAHQVQDVGRGGMLLPYRPDTIADFVMMLRNREAGKIAA